MELALLLRVFVIFGTGLSMLLFLRLLRTAIRPFDIVAIGLFETLAFVFLIVGGVELVEFLIED